MKMLTRNYVKVLLFEFAFCFFHISCQFGNGQWPGLFERKQKPLKIDGSWSNWEQWSGCYGNSPSKENFYKPWEGFVVESRKRECNSPAPLYGGAECLPPSYRYKQCSCQNPIGISTSRISNNQMTSSEHLQKYPAWQGRLGSNFSGWCSNERLSFLKNTYLEIDFGGFVNVGAIATMGIKNGRVSRYKLKYSLDGEKWENIYQEQNSAESLFKGNVIPRKVILNNFDSHKIMKHLRYFPTATFGSPCVKMELYGCIFTCGNYLSNSFGEISAQSKSHYDQNCLWKVEVQNTTSLTFDFNVFYLNCEDGYLNFYDGSLPFSAESNLLAHKCLSNEDEELPLLKININSVWINFVSNSSSSEVGFNIKYFSECSQIIHLKKGEEVILKSPNFPNNYFDNLDCVWTVVSPNLTNKIDMKINKFKVESSSSEENPCLDDYVTIHIELNNNKKTYGSRYCNNNKLQEKISFAAEKLKITFKSDAYSTEQGFSMSLISGEKKVITPVDSGNKRDVTTQAATKQVLMNNRSNGTFRGKKVKKNKDDTWTVIIIATFSTFCFVLFMFVAGTSLKRFIENRNEVNAQCAKMMEVNTQKKKQIDKIATKQKINQTNFYQQENKSSNAVETEKLPMLNNSCDQFINDPNTEALKFSSTAIDGDTPTISDIELMLPCDNGSGHKHDKIVTPDLIESHDSNVDLFESDEDVNNEPVDNVSFDSSSPQIHSPLKTNVDNEESESCV